MLQSLAVTCPYCGEAYDALIDTSEGDADYVEDCAVCCHPIRFRVRVDDDGPVQVETEREDD